ncbi:hypothetical protein GA0061077_1107 [Bifidobacterium commune]|uniref:Uncharacterized protein n=1 Tax=Bifidobacterium commune TaxID=1505727 RepID=A0A1C4H5P7_9BIFI|nr:hypothetical protein GA0061077_1107 [Bifidobacterium commune]
MDPLNRESATYSERVPVKFVWDPLAKVAHVVVMPVVVATLTALFHYFVSVAALLRARETA